MNKVEYFIYSDGAAKGNPDGRGGYGTIVKRSETIIVDDKITGVNLTIEEFTEGFKVASNNQMELLGAIVGIENTEENTTMTITSDSAYLVNAINKKWIDNWISNGWITSNRQPVKNQDLWQRLLKAMENRDVKFKWVKGHNGHPENERCDFLATSSAEEKKMVKKNGVYMILNE